MAEPLVRRVLGLFGMGFARHSGPQAVGPGQRSFSPAASVSTDTAMQVSAVWACAKLITENVSTLPMSIVSLGEFRDVTQEFPAGRLLTRRANANQTGIEFAQTNDLDLILNGNAYARKVRNAGQLIALEPLASAQVETRVDREGKVFYLYHHDGGVDTIAPENMWHRKLFGNGVVGLSPLGYAAQTIGTSIAGEREISKVYKQGRKPAGVLTVDGKLNDDQKRQVREEFRELSEGESERLMVLPGKMAYEKVSMSPEDIQLLETRRFQVEDIARFFGVPSVLINDTQATTNWGSGVQQLIHGFYKLTLRPLLEAKAASILHNLVGDPRQRRRVTIRFNIDPLLMLGQKERAEAGRAEVNAALKAPNEWRAEEGLPPLSGGDMLLVNGSLKPLSEVRSNGD